MMQESFCRDAPSSAGSGPRKCITRSLSERKAFERELRRIQQVFEIDALRKSSPLLRETLTRALAEEWDWCMSDRFSIDAASIKVSPSCDREQYLAACETQEISNGD